VDLNQAQDTYQDVLPHLSPVWTHYTDIIASRAEGCYVYDLNGRAYLDFTCGIGVTNTGHCHPLVVEAIRQQAGLLLHGQVNIILHRPLLELVRALRPIVPESIDSFFFSNSGAEAVEGAVKLARHATGRPNVIVFQGSFHGRTASTMALTTSKTVYRAGFQPLPSGVFVTPYPYAYRYGWSAAQTTGWCLEELEFLLLTQSAPHETAAILIESVLGEGGYVVPPVDFMRRLRQLCDRHGILLITDEIQSGFGRTGRWFALEHFGIQPDIMTVAKGWLRTAHLGRVQPGGRDAKMGPRLAWRHFRRQRRGCRGSSGHHPGHPIRGAAGKCPGARRPAGRTPACPPGAVYSARRRTRPGTDGGGRVPHPPAGAG
jgi:4-aminobutyrate aminotransferase